MKTRQLAPTPLASTLESERDAQIISDAVTCTTAFMNAFEQDIEDGAIQLPSHGAMTVDMARSFARHLAFESDDDDVAWGKFFDDDNQSPLLAMHWNGNPCNQTWMRFCARWGRVGFPLVRLQTADYAAALCNTNVPEELLTMVRAPWRAFAIEVPGGDILIDGRNGAHPVKTILAHEYFELGGYKWSIILHGDTVAGTPRQYNPIVDRSGLRIDELVFLPSECEDSYSERLIQAGARKSGQTDRDKRALIMAGHLVAGVCMGFDVDGNVRKLPSSRKERRALGVRNAEFPMTNAYILGRPVIVSTRDAVREYIAGTRRNPLTVQSLIRGHWKQQPYGPRNSLRKTIHVEPFWRGPAKSPIAVRSHVLKEASDDQ